MRIISGSFKGRKLLAPGGTKTRPTSDRVREAIFSIIGDRVPGSRVLDLYAGTGAMGLEAISRGAARAVFVETDVKALNCLRKNITAVDCGESAKAVSRSVISFLGSMDPEAGYDLVFADPPYAGDLGTLTLLAISKHATPLKDCLIVLEHAPGASPEPVPENMEVLNSRVYGNTGVTFLSFR
ncbi:MAG: 16S rRNA (guanine(966)-N(2))-methyltransferase RsmD [Pseudomonadota bacterium]